LKEGASLSQVTREFCAAWGIKQTVLPMSDSPVRTIVDTDEGELAFQEYFVHRHCEPRVKGFRFDGVEVAQPAIGAREAIESAQAVVICPSNPWVSIDPILRVLKKINKPVVAVSPIIGGKTVKGPAAKMYAELGIEPSALAVAEHYHNLLTGFVFDSQDKQLSDNFKKGKIMVTDTLMNSPADRARLAMDVLQFVGSL
jgi:LPPG:FO 2-phospho-L-lactate transferase